MWYPGCYAGPMFFLAPCSKGQRVTNEHRRHTHPAIAFAPNLSLIPCLSIPSPALPICTFPLTSFILFYFPLSSYPNPLSYFIFLPPLHRLCQAFFSLLWKSSLRSFILSFNCHHLSFSSFSLQSRKSHPLRLSFLPFSFSSNVSIFLPPYLSPPVSPCQPSLSLQKESFL